MAYNSFICCWNLVAQTLKNPPAMWENWIRSLVGKLSWRRVWQPTLVFLPGESPWTEEPGRLQSIGSQSVRHEWATKHSKFYLLMLKIFFLYLLFSCLVVSDSLWPHGLQHARPPCPSPPGIYSNSCPLSQWCHPTISSSVVPFSSCLQSLPASGSFLMNQLFKW